jgi:hypothetical protein
MYLYSLRIVNSTKIDLLSIEIINFLYPVFKTETEISERADSKTGGLAWALFLDIGKFFGNWQS